MSKKTRKFTYSEKLKHHNDSIAENKNEAIMRGREKWNILLGKAGIKSNL